jgi:hypothetical protein
VSKSFSVPGNVGDSATVTITVDKNNNVLEDKENDNVATRRIRLFDPPPDRTPPVVNNVFISDDNPFNDNDQIATTRNVQVKIVATDPTSPAPQSTSGLESFCLVRYAYDQVRRRWVEETCIFQPLSAPVAPNTFIVNTQLRPKEGVGYIFAWVKDGDGNISRTPGFDFISFIPGNPINLNRNDVRIFRISVPTGSFQLTVTPSSGDVDVSVFQGFGVNAPRCALSVNNGSQPETVTVPNTTPPNTCSGTEFQLEVKAIVNSRFTINTVVGASATTTAGEISVAAVSNEPTVGGPPALQTAIGEEQLFLPIIIK